MTQVPPGVFKPLLIIWVEPKRQDGRSGVYEFQFLTSEPSVGVLEFQVSGEVDMATVGPLKEAVDAAVASRDYESLVFDLCGVSFMDSAGLHVVAEAHRAMRLAGGS